MLLMFAQSPFQSPGAPQVVQNANALEDNYNKKKQTLLFPLLRLTPLSPLCQLIRHSGDPDSYCGLPYIMHKKSLFSKWQTILFWK